MTPRILLALLGLALFSPGELAAQSAQMLNPAPGSTFSSSSASFNWSAGSATSYILLVGSSQYAHDIYSIGPTSVLSATVNNIPTDGRTIFVTLASNVGGSWPSNNSTYTAASSSTTPTPTPPPPPTAPSTPTPTPGAVDPLTWANVQTITK